MDTNEKIERMIEIREEVLTLVDEAFGMLRGLGVIEERARCYWVGHVKCAMASDEYPTRYETTIQNTIDDLEELEGEEDDDDNL